MHKISFEDVKNAFATNRGKKLKLLYLYYKEDYFVHGFTAEFIASNISIHLGYQISKHTIYQIFRTYLKQDKLCELKEKSFSSSNSKQNIKSSEHDAKEEKPRWSSSDDPDKMSPVEKAFAHLKKRNQ